MADLMQMILLINICKLTCHLSSPQMRKTSSEKQSVLPFDIAPIGFENLVPPGLASRSVT